MFETEQVNKKLHLYQATVILSVLFAFIGFSYNVWRMEASEHNNNVRTACFEMLVELSTLEQLVYIAHYDGDLKEGSPRKGWVKIRLLNDLSVLTSTSVEQQADKLKTVWSKQWETMADNQTSVENIVNAIDDVRAEIKTVLRSLD